MRTDPGAGTAEVLSGWGISATLRGSWEGRLFLRPSPAASFASPGVRAAAPVGPAGGGVGWVGEVPTPVLHLGNFPLPSGRGDFGSGAVDRMSGGHAFVALLEFGPDEVGSALFADEGLPRPRLGDFGPSTLQIRIAGQLGFQRFFTVSARPMCLFVVLGSRSSAATLVPQVTEVLDEVVVS